MSEPVQKPGRSKQDYETPWALIDAVIERYGPLAWDLAACSDTTKAGHFYTEGDNSLIQPWENLRGNLWLNPPFGDIAPWARKCAETVRQFKSARDMILLLTPASIGSNWFSEFVYPHARVIALSPRLSFDGKNPFPKDCILSLYSRGYGKGFDVWRWDAEVKAA